MKIALLGIVIATIGFLFVIQDLGYQTNTDPNAPDPNENPDKFNSPESETTPPAENKEDCDPSYPDFCISSPPPDLDCKDISQKRFTVLSPDPHRFDGDKNGIGCES